MCILLLHADGKALFSILVFFFAKFIYRAPCLQSLHVLETGTAHTKKNSLRDIKHIVTAKQPTHICHM